MCCWENVIGQELFKLTVVRLLVDVFTNVVDGVRWAANRNLGLAKYKLTAWVSRAVCMCVCALSSCVTWWIVVSH